jgi:hypothetical protein
MFRTSVFFAIAFAIAAMGSAAAPASAFSSQVFNARNEQVFAHSHPITSVQPSWVRPPSKKKP